MIRYAIKSHARTDVLKAQTLRVLEAGGVPLDAVHVFVSGAVQRELYERDVGPLGPRVVEVQVPGVMAAVAAIQRYFPEGSNVVHLDDDVRSLVRLEDGVLAELEPGRLAGIVDSAFAECAAAGARLWGIYPVANKMFMGTATTRDLRFVWAGCYGFISDGARAEAPSVEMKDDFERSIRSYVRCGAVVRLNWLAAKTRFFTKAGGTGEDPKRLEAHLRDAHLLASCWPEFCFLAKKKGFGGLDVRLRSRPKVFRGQG